MTQLPTGARLYADFITQDDESASVRHLEHAPWSADLKRRVQHFGYRYDYKARMVTERDYIGPLPAWLEPVCRRLVEAGLFLEMPDQVIANEYLPGQGISAHVDCVPCFEDRIVSISLLSACEMVFRRVGGDEKRSLILAPRSALLLEGPARYDWTHEIPARKSDLIDGVRTERSRRVSLTFRKVIRPN